MGNIGGRKVTVAKGSLYSVPETQLQTFLLLRCLNKEIIIKHQESI